MLPSHLASVLTSDWMIFPAGVALLVFLGVLTVKGWR